MSTYKPADSKREEFRKYLEKTGVLDAFTKTLVELYEENEKPNEPLQFVKNSFCKFNSNENFKAKKILSNSFF
jgi:hypothetical protein